MTERVSIAFENYYAPWDRWFDVRAYPANDAGLSIYFQDITDKMRAEQALRHLNETLEAQVLQRTERSAEQRSAAANGFRNEFHLSGTNEP